MAGVRRTIGIVLLILAGVKLIGIVVMAIDGSPDYTTFSYAKQLIYVGALLFFGVTLLRTERSDQSGGE